MGFDGDIRLNFLNPPQLLNGKDNMFSPDVLMYMCKALLQEEEEEHRRETTAKEKLPEIFKGNPSEAEHFIYQFAAYFMSNDDELVLASSVARVVLTLSWVKGEEVDQWVDQQLQWLEVQDQQDLKVGSAFVEALFEQFMPKGRWQNIARIEMKWPYINEYISDSKKAHVYSRQPLKGINQVQWFIEGFAGSMKEQWQINFKPMRRPRNKPVTLWGYRNSSTKSTRKRMMHGQTCKDNHRRCSNPQDFKSPSTCTPGKNRSNKRKHNKHNKGQQRKRKEQKHTYSWEPPVCP